MISLVLEMPSCKRKFMILKLIALALSGAISVDVALTTHELLAAAKSPVLAALGDRMVPLDEEIDLRKAQTDPDHADAHLKTALAKNPWNTENWIRLSVDAESSGNIAEATYDLEQASRHDAGAAPRWANANFYFRRGDERKFLVWVNRYREVTHEDELGLFRMAIENTSDLHALLSSMPNLGCDELDTLLGTVREQNLDPDEIVQRMTGSCHDEASAKALDRFITDLLRSDKVDLAERVRQRRGDRDPLVNASFSRPVTGEGFDWRVNLSGSVQMRQDGKQGIQFEFDDRVPSGTVLIFQPIALPTGSHYRLSMNVESDPPDQEDFRWELVELSTGRHLASGLDEENINRMPAWRFEVPPSNKTLALALFYKRSSGELPFQGTLNVEGVHLARELAPGSIQGKH